jgi:hypothetical protein
MVADHVARDAEQPSASVSCGVQAVGAPQSLRERLGRDVDCIIAAHTTCRVAVDGTEMGRE